MKKYLSIILTVACISISHAQLVTDRPDQTESAMTVPKRSLQIESGIQVTTSDQSRQEYLLPTMLLRLGLSDNFELRFVSQFEKESFRGVDYSGISDLEVGFKLWLAGGRTSPTNIALLSHVILPSGSFSTTEDSYGINNKLALSHELPNDLSISYNLGHTYISDVTNDLTYTLALGWGLSDKLGVYIEPYGALVDMEDHEMAMDGGFTYFLKPNIQLDVSAGTGLNYDMNYIALGMSWLLR